MTEYYVDVDGIGGTPSDSNAGTISEPWKTIPKANSKLVSGDTVYLRAGTYADTIIPINSGSAGNIITYENYNNEIVYIKGNTSIYDGGQYVSYGIYIDTKNYINIIGIIFQRPLFDAGATRARWFGLHTVSHIKITDCDFTLGDENFRYAMSKLSDMSHSQFLNCSWDASSTDVNSDTQNDLMSIHGIAIHNLWKNCEFGDVSHSQVYYETNDAEYNVFTGSVWHNKWRHAITTRKKRTLIDNNIFYGFASEGEFCPYFADRITNNRYPSVIYSMASTYSIHRKNIIYDSDHPITISSFYGAPTHNWIYSNTIYNTIGYAGTNTHRAIAIGGTYSGINTPKYNNILNNIFSETENVRQFEWYNYEDAAYNPINNKFHYNIVHDTTDNSGRWGAIRGTLAYVENNHTDFIPGTNSNSNPLMTDPANQDFTLQSTSPCINTGTHLTTIISSTNTGQNSIIVDDATPFYSGAGEPWLIEGEVGDTIKTAAGKETVIQSIDYGTNTLTVSPAIDIVNGEGISLTYTGTAPNIGALEYIPNDPCSGVVCLDTCLGNDRWSQKCVDGICVADQLLATNSTFCSSGPCAGVDCPDICIGNNRWSQRCDPATGQCIPFQLIQADSIDCKINAVPADESKIATYLVLGGLGFAGLVMLLISKNRGGA